jgi:hypothetical protein
LGEHLRLFFNIPKEPPKEKTTRDMVRYLGVKDVAYILDISEEKVRMYTRQGLLPCLRKGHKATNTKKRIYGNF